MLYMMAKKVFNAAVGDFVRAARAAGATYGDSSLDDIKSGGKDAAKEVEKAKDATADDDAKIAEKQDEIKAKKDEATVKYRDSRGKTETIKVSEAKVRNEIEQNDINRRKSRNKNNRERHAGSSWFPRGGGGK